MLDALRATCLEGRKEMSNFRLGVEESVVWRSVRSSSIVRPKRGLMSKKALKGSKVAGRAFLDDAGAEEVVVRVAFWFRMRRHSAKVLFGAATKRGVLSTKTCRCGSGSRLSWSRPKSSASE